MSYWPILTIYRLGTAVAEGDVHWFSRGVPYPLEENTTPVNQRQLGLSGVLNHLRVSPSTRLSRLKYLKKQRADAPAKSALFNPVFAHRDDRKKHLASYSTADLAQHWLGLLLSTTAALVPPRSLSFFCLSEVTDPPLIVGTALTACPLGSPAAVQSPDRSEAGALLSGFQFKGALSKCPLSDVSSLLLLAQLHPESSPRVQRSTVGPV
jgi:hypothetical protein